MRRFLPLLVVVFLIGCSPTPGGTAGAATPATAGPGSSVQPTPGAPSSGEPAPASASAGTVLPADCAAGLAAYLVAIEPIVSSFDPATATLGDLSAVDEPRREKSLELLDANGGRATYSCSEVGLEWAYFDSSTPWDAVLAVAADSAPGTVPYLTGVRATTGLDEAELSAYDIEGCGEAVQAIKEQVADEIAAGTDGAKAMPFNDGVALLGIYRAYMRQVQLEVCPRDELGNDEFMFFGSLG